MAFDSLVPSLGRDVLSSNASVVYPAIALLALAVAAHTLTQVFFEGNKPRRLPWAPSGTTGMLAALQSALASTLSIQRALTVGRLLPAAHNTGFKISTILDGTVVVLPPEQSQWLARLPETTASFNAKHYERLQLQYTLPAMTLTNPALARLITQLMTRRSKSAVPDVHDEIEAVCADAAYGGADWQSVCVFDEMQRILSAMTNACWSASL